MFFLQLPAEPQALDYRSSDANVEVEAHLPSGIIDVNLRCAAIPCTRRLAAAGPHPSPLTPHPSPLSTTQEHNLNMTHCSLVGDAETATVYMQPFMDFFNRYQVRRREERGEVDPGQS